MTRRISLWLAATLTSTLASAAALTVIVSAHADFGPAVDVKVVRDAVVNASLPPGITPEPITVSDVAVVGNFALATYHAGTSVSQQGFCRQHGTWTRIFAGIGGTADLIQAGYPPEIAKKIVSHLEESRGVDALGRDPQSTPGDRKMFGPEGIAAATEHFKQNSRCDYF